MLVRAHVRWIAENHVCLKTVGGVAVQVAEHPLHVEFELGSVAARYIEGRGTYVKSPYVQVRSSLGERERNATTACSQVEDDSTSRGAFGCELDELFGFRPRNKHRWAHLNT